MFSIYSTQQIQNTNLARVIHLYATEKSQRKHHLGLNRAALKKIIFGYGIFAVL
jgi:hypothetical protein